MAENLKKQPLSQNAFYMWRCVIAMSFADRIMQIAEQKHLEKALDGLNRTYNLTPEQKQTFAQDMKKPQNVFDLLRHINDSEYRAMVLQFSQELAWADGHVSDEEQTILDRLHLELTPGIDRAKLQSEIHDLIALRREERMAELKQLHAKAQARNMYGVFAPLDRLMLRLGIDILD